MDVDHRMSAGTRSTIDSRDYDTSPCTSIRTLLLCIASNGVYRYTPTKRLEGFGRGTDDVNRLPFERRGNRSRTLMNEARGLPELSARAVTESWNGKIKLRGMTALNADYLEAIFSISRFLRDACIVAPDSYPYNGQGNIWSWQLEELLEIIYRLKKVSHT